MGFLVSRNLYTLKLYSSTYTRSDTPMAYVQYTHPLLALRQHQTIERASSFRTSIFIDFLMVLKNMHLAFTSQCSAREHRRMSYTTPRPTHHHGFLYMAFYCRDTIMTQHLLVFCLLYAYMWGNKNRVHPRDQNPRPSRLITSALSLGCSSFTCDPQLL